MSICGEPSFRLVEEGLLHSHGEKSITHSSSYRYVEDHHLDRFIGLIVYSIIQYIIKLFKGRYAIS